MRSRYSAYALNISSYIVATTHPASPEYSENLFSWKRSISKFSTSTSFQKLEILDFKEKNTLATVTFTAYIHQEQDATFTEKSYFEKIGSKWLYRGGQLVEGHVPNLVTTGQLKLLPLAYYGDPILRKQAEPVQKITGDIKTLVEEMMETMEASGGIGLAAPQVHHSIRLFIARSLTETADGKFEKGPAQVFINPELLEPSEETWKETEGCLSIPTLRSIVERPKEVTVRYTSIDGTTVQKRFSGWSARVIQHENDHIDGILFFDHLSDEEKNKLAPLLEKIKKRIHDERAF